jgi:hypothetical protein
MMGPDRDVVDEAYWNDWAASGGRAVTMDGSRLTSTGDRPNLDPIDVAAGLRLAAAWGYDDGESQMVIEYALMRHRRGEEAGAERTALSHGIDFTSWRACLAAAMAASVAASSGGVS